MLHYKIANEEFIVDATAPIDISIPLSFDGPQPNHFGADRAVSRPLMTGDFIGDTSQGGSCNVKQIALVPHCNGTHTESVSHIVDELININTLAAELMPATLITVLPESGEQTNDNYRPNLKPTDKVISKNMLVQELSSIDNDFLKVLVVRTLPNPLDKRQFLYNKDYQPPFFSCDAIEYINQKGVEHVVVDFPSIDKMYDQGKLTNHHLFWNIEENTHTLGKHAWTHKTITEMAFINKEVVDGQYLISLNLAPFNLDAAPSRPILYPMELVS